MESGDVFGRRPAIRQMSTESHAHEADEDDAPSYHELAEMVSDLKDEVETLQEKSEMVEDPTNGLVDLRVANYPIGGLLEKQRETIESLEKENEELRKSNQDLRKRVSALEARVDPDPTTKEYDEMTKAERVRCIRTTLVNQAKKSPTKKSEADYKQISAMFDGIPSAGYCYKLMKQAANEDGFSYEKPKDKATQVRVDLAAVKDDSLLSHRE